MKISYRWLRELVHLPKDVAPVDIAHRLTFAGLEVEGLTAVGEGISGLVVAEVRGRRPHPKADKLTLVDVFDGQTLTQVVCGAPNVPEPGEPGAGPRVVWARPGATLPGGLTLGEKEVRGVRSPGMLCAEDELGLSTDHAGILLLRPEDGIAIGADFLGAAGLPDVILELNVTANRPDCLGHVGVAREVAALFHKEGAHLLLQPPDLLSYLLPERHEDEVRIDMLEPEGCPRYTARVLRGVRVGKSPLRLRLLLSRLGVRAISNVVDATNLTMLEWGQPLHAFDLARLRGPRIVVRRGHPGETLATLDGQVRAVQTDDLLIADGVESGRGVALAGVMGGRDSEVGPATTDLLLESAYFHPSWVRRTARRLRLHSEASHRFERGVDPNEGVVRASLACTQRILELCGGQVAPELHDAYVRPVPPPTVSVRPARTRLLLGADLSAEVQAQTLRALGLGVSLAGGTAAHDDAGTGVRAGEPGELHVSVPTARPDLSREADLIEEIGRLIGYEAIPARLPPLHLSAAEAGARATRPGLAGDLARDLCRALGLDEIVAFSFVAPERLRLLGYPPGDRRGEPLCLHNPLREELSAMRTTLAVGLLEALRRHLSHGVAEVRLFEVGEIFLRPVGLPPGAVPSPEAMPEERLRVAGVLSGHRDGWLKSGKDDELDFYDVRGVVEELLAGLGRSGAAGGAVEIRAARPDEAPWLHPGVSAVVVDPAGELLGWFGEVHPTLRERLEIEARAFAFELDIPEGPAARLPYVPLPRFPGASRDLSFFVDAAVPAAALLAALRGAGQALLAEARVLEDYREPGRVPAGKKGMLLGLVYRSPERTLTDEEVGKAHEAVLLHLQQKVAIELR